MTDPGAGPAVDDDDTAVENVNTATGKLSDATGKLSPALDDLKTGFTAYHQANVDGLNTLAEGINQNMGDLAGVVSGQTAQTASLQGTIAQMQIQLGNIANSGSGGA